MSRIKGINWEHKPGSDSVVKEITKEKIVLPPAIPKVKNNVKYLGGKMKRAYLFIFFIVMILIVIFGCDKEGATTPEEPYIPAPDSLNIKVIATNPTTIELSWNYSYTNDVIFHIDRKIGGGGWFENYANTDTTFYVDYQATYGENNYYRVYVKKGDYTSEYSNEIYECPKLKGISSCGAGTQCGVSGCYFRFGWSAPSDPGRQYFCVTLEWYPGSYSTITTSDHISVYSGIPENTLIHGIVKASDGLHYGSYCRAAGIFNPHKKK